MGRGGGTPEAEGERCGWGRGNRGRAQRRGVRTREEGRCGPTRSPGVTQRCYTERSLCNTTATATAPATAPATATTATTTTAIASARPLPPPRSRVLHWWGTPLPPSPRVSARSVLAVAGVDADSVAVRAMGYDGWRGGGVLRLRSAWPPRVGSIGSGDGRVCGGGENKTGMAADARVDVGVWGTAEPGSAGAPY
jgi:hypothetical protein